MSVKISGETVILKKLFELRTSAQVGSPAIYKALKTVAILIEAQAKLNLKREKMIDSGFLINSIRHEIIKGDGSLIAQIGSYGVVYARIHEMGGEFSSKMRRAMFWRLRKSGRFDRNYAPKDVAPDPRDGRYRSRPYMGPAYELKKERIAQILNKAIMGEGS